MKIGTRVRHDQTQDTGILLAIDANYRALIEWDSTGAQGWITRRHLVDLCEPAKGYVNARAAAGWVAVCLGRQSAVEVGSMYRGRLWVGEVIDHSRTDLIELGARVYAYLGRPPATFRERLP